MSSEMDKGKGRTKQAIGDLTDDKQLQAEGERDEAAGKAKDLVDQAKEKVEDAIDSVRKKLD